MKNLLKSQLGPALLCLAGVCAAPQAAAGSAEEVVRAYADAASRNDLEAFLALYDPDIRKFRFPGELSSRGLEHNRRAYAQSFPRHPQLRVDIVQLIALGNKVMVHDRVSGLPDGAVVDELTVYEVDDGRIVNIMYVERLAQEMPR
jgi:hypothetical protein